MVLFVTSVITAVLCGYYEIIPMKWVMIACGIWFGIQAIAFMYVMNCKDNRGKKNIRDL